MEDNNQWLQCHSEDDARLIAEAPVYKYDALERLRSGCTLAAELDRLADLLQKYDIGFWSRFFRRRAAEARGECT